MKIEGLEVYQSKLEKPQGAGLSLFVRESFSQWAGAGIPTIKDEEWKYTSLADTCQPFFPNGLASSINRRQTIFGLSR